MLILNNTQIRNYWLRVHHLDKFYTEDDLFMLVGACGFQNTPSQSWQMALHNRIKDCNMDINNLLYVDKTLLQAWSLRGAPFIFPTLESDIFLSSLLPESDELWIYTRGITLALDALQMSFNDVLSIILNVIGKLDNHLIQSKISLDQTIADWMFPLLPIEKREIWQQPSMYGMGDKQSIGGAVVSFLLRPCSYYGLIVFGERIGNTPTFTSYKNWVKKSMNTNNEATINLVRKFVHCYGPTNVNAFMQWLGSCKQQAKRIWNLIEPELACVLVNGKKGYILSHDKDTFLIEEKPQREYHLLGAYDPYLNQHNHELLLADTKFHPLVWKTISNPNIILHHGEIIGLWKATRKAKGIIMTLTLWKDIHQYNQQVLIQLAHEYVRFKKESLIEIRFARKE